MSRLVDPRMVKALSHDFFNARAALKAPVKTQSTTGQEERTFVVQPGLDSIPCRVAVARGGEHRTSMQVYSDTTHIITLAAQVQGLTKEWIATVSGQDYLILLVSVEAEGVLTQLQCRIVL